MTASTPAAVATPRPPRNRDTTGSTWPTTAATPRTYAPRCPARRRPAADGIAPLAKSPTKTMSPAFQPARRYTFEAPGFPEPSAMTSCPVARATSAAVGKVPRRYARGTRSRTPVTPVALAVETRECQRPHAGPRNDADLPVPVREVRRAVRALAVHPRRLPRAAPGVRRQGHEGDVAGRHRAQGPRLLPDRQPCRRQARQGQGAGEGRRERQRLGLRLEGVEELHRLRLERLEERAVEGLGERRLQGLQGRDVQVRLVLELTPANFLGHSPFLRGPRAASREGEPHASPFTTRRAPVARRDPHRGCHRGRRRDRSRGAAPARRHARPAARRGRRRP